MLRKILFCILLGAISLMNMTVLAAQKPKEERKSRFEYLELFNKVLYQIEAEYYRSVDVEKLIKGAIKGMMETLDPHSAYLDKEVFERMQTDTSGKFGGLGIEVTVKDGILTIITTIDETPAHKAGLLPRDKIVEINHDSTIGLSLEEAVDKMRGSPNTKVNLGIVRDGVEGVQYFSVQRKVVKLKPVKSSLLKDEYAFIRLKQFQKGAGESIVQVLKKYARKKIKGIILDLRSNPGGLLDEAVEVSSIFLKDGIVVSTEGRDPKNKEIRYVKKNGFKDLKTPLVVLINGASASASEIVAGALQDHKRAIVMGARSFGKGSVQTVRGLDEKTGLKLTISQYMTPKNRRIQAIGIKPDVELDELDAKWVDQRKNMTKYIREVDLRNHLVSTIETEEERKHRIAKERKERIAKRKAFKERQKKQKLKDKTHDYQAYDPNEDYQVIQAINYLKSFKIFKKLDSTVKL